MDSSGLFAEHQLNFTAVGLGLDSGLTFGCSVCVFIYSLGLHAWLGEAAAGRRTWNTRATRQTCETADTEAPCRLRT